MWNYRVCKEINTGPLPKEEPFVYHIREVYYGADGKIMGYAEAGVDNWTSPEELRATLLLMLKAFDKPILEPE